MKPEKVFDELIKYITKKNIFDKCFLSYSKEFSIEFHKDKNIKEKDSWTHNISYTPTHGYYVRIGETRYLQKDMTLSQIKYIIKDYI